MTQWTLEELEAGLDRVRRSPHGVGPLELIVRRPAIGEREIVDEGRLDLETGLAGDNWQIRGSMTRPDRSAHPDAQLTIMNARAAALVAGPIERWALAGDQMYVDLDLSEDRLPAGSRLTVGSAVIEISPRPHRGCAKFAQRFGVDALRFVNTRTVRALNLRGRYARVVTPGTIHRHDPVRVDIAHSPEPGTALNSRAGAPESRRGR